MALGSPSLLRRAMLAGGIGLLIGPGCAGKDDPAPTESNPDSAADSATPTDAGPRPNILLVVMDDVGIDQMEVFGFGSATAPATPNLATLADSGVRFSNTWSMPACSPSRAALFDGRYPFRTNVLGALGPDDLANSMVSPYETTAPKLLAGRGYESGLFGKFHLGIQGNNPDGYAMAHTLGWNYYWGWLDETGDPSSIDTTAGGVGEPGAFPCGFVPGVTQENGASSGACHAPEGSCEALTSVGTPPGRTCRDQGGIFVPREDCASSPPDLDFDTLSAHYVSPLVIVDASGAVEQVPVTDRRARTFRATAMVDAAAEWINTRPEGTPWMASVMFASTHTPVMQPPAGTLDDESPTASNLDCSVATDQREISNLMIESIDAEIARLLVTIGVAAYGSDGELVYDPAQSDTMVIVVGDNGSLGTFVKVPFDQSRAKGTAYQTGVWVPLIVSGPLVVTPNRSVTHMVNVTDLYALYAEIAGVDVAAEVPRPVDAVSMLPYLTNPSQTTIRTTNFTQIGQNLQVDRAINGPCNFGTQCSHIPVTKGVCEDNNGVWWGAGHDDPAAASAPPEGYTRCCEVAADFYARGEGDSAPVSMPDQSVAVRNPSYKVVRNTAWIYDVGADACAESTTTEFFAIDEVVPTLDVEGSELPLDALTAEQQSNYDALVAELDSLLGQTPDCPGDGTLDSMVDADDVDGWTRYAGAGLSSVFDFDLDGLTDDADRAVIDAHLDETCVSR